MNYWSDKRVLVTGGAGFLGHHVVTALKQSGCQDIFVVRRTDYDLSRESDVERLFQTYCPDIVFHLAGLVGGIWPNKTRPAEFFYQNLMMGTLNLHYACKSGVTKFIAAGAGCGYPEFATIPLQEDSFWDGFPQKESAPYSLAKRLLSIQASAYFQQYGFVSIICIPGNLYGPWDNFNLGDAHVIPALIRKFVEAQRDSSPTVQVWGTGRPTRDFVYVRDVAQAMLKAAEIYRGYEIVNISSGIETSVLEVCQALKAITDYKGEIVWDHTKPDGQMRRCFDVSKAKKDLDFLASTGIYQGLLETVNWYSENLNNVEIRR